MCVELVSQELSGLNVEVHVSLLKEGLLVGGDDSIENWHNSYCDGEADKAEDAVGERDWSQVLRVGVVRIKIFFRYKLDQGIENIVIGECRSCGTA